MSTPDTAVSARRKSVPLVRNAAPARSSEAAEPPVTTARHTNFVSHPLEDPMTVRTRQAAATGYYLGRPAAFWFTVLKPRSTTRKSPRGSALEAERPRQAARAASAAK